MLKRSVCGTAFFKIWLLFSPRMSYITLFYWGATIVGSDLSLEDFLDTLIYLIWSLSFLSPIRYFRIANFIFFFYSSNALKLYSLLSIFWIFKVFASISYLLLSMSFSFWTFVKCSIGIYFGSNPVFILIKSRWFSSSNFALLNSFDWFKMLLRSCVEETWVLKGWAKSQIPLLFCLAFEEIVGWVIRHCSSSKLLWVLISLVSSCLYVWNDKLY